MPVDLPPPTPPRPGASLGAGAERLSHRWGWIIAFGAFSALMGIVALVLVETATVASVLVIGFFMVFAGTSELVMGLRMRSWGRLILLELAGLLYIVSGVFAIALPELASVVLTLLLGAAMLATGIVRVVLGFKVGGSRSRAGVVLAGLITAVLGVLILASWPGSSVIVLGTFLGIDLLFYGVTWIVFGYRLRLRHR